MDKLLSLGIDPWSILLYWINTGLLLTVLTYLLYKPILGFIDKRRQQIIDSIDESTKMKESFEKKLSESEKKREENEAQLKEELANLYKFTEQKRAQLTSEMEQARTEMMQTTQKEMDDKKSTLIKEAEKDIKNLMTRIILEIVERKVPEEVITESISSAWKTYNK